MTLFFVIFDCLLFAVLMLVGGALARDTLKAIEARRPIDKVKVGAAALLIIVACRLVAP